MTLLVELHQEDLLEFLPDRGLDSRLVHRNKPIYHVWVQKMRLMKGLREGILIIISSNLRLEGVQGIFGLAKCNRKSPSVTLRE